MTPTPECTCSLSIKLAGDGCSICNPELAAEIAEDNRKDTMNTPTPRTDAAAFVASKGFDILDAVTVEFSEQLERDITELNERLIDRQATLMSQSLKISSLQRIIKTIYDRTEGFADGAPDASPHDKLCNEISSKLKLFIK